MAEYFDLELDTTAPVVTWGTPSGSAPGEAFSVSYTLDEPDILSAYLESAGGTQYPLTVGPTEITGTLPLDSDAGVGHVVAVVEDEVGNQAERRLAVQLQGQFIEIELDTTPPVITWGSYSGAEAGDNFSIAYTIDEPEILSVKLVDFVGQEVALTVGPSTLAGAVPSNFFEGTAQVIAHVKDDVDNETFRVFAFHLEGVPVVVTEEEERRAGGGRIISARPAFTRDEQRFPAVVSSRRIEVVRFSAFTSAQRQQEFQFSGFVSATKEQSFHFQANRIPDLQLAQVRREEEEILLLI